jgi:NAD(P)-dependent dehydrogenase (short-subunit alcohol dehydrogenase family)
MQILADEIGNSAIRVNSIAPGPTRTSLRTQAFPGEDPATVKSPEALMPLYLWLMGADSSGKSGMAVDAEAENPFR